MRERDGTKDALAERDERTEEEREEESEDEDENPDVALETQSKEERAEREEESEETGAGTAAKREDETEEETKARTGFAKRGLGGIAPEQELETGRTEGREEHEMGNLPLLSSIKDKGTDSDRRETGGWHTQGVPDELAAPDAAIASLLYNASCSHE